MSIFDLVWSLPSEKKKQAILDEVSKHLVGKVIKSISLDPKTDSLGRYIQINMIDGATLTVAEETVTSSDGGPMDAFVIRVNGGVVAKL